MSSSPGPKCPVCSQTMTSPTYCVSCGFKDEDGLLQRQMEVDQRYEGRRRSNRFLGWLFRLFGR